ncbi:Transcription factor MYB98 [Acorus calamus]|uniref:Transcription factor MYB98 n=1 Tax=Acorus calamus TaxID=4465 RepID=A0AAV9D9P8_ACOCL|nr:Transcription factor MYB98 [Acorus calamus]
MEERGDFGHGYVEENPYFLSLKPQPPLTPLERFLSSSNVGVIHYSKKSNQRRSKNSEGGGVMENGLCRSSSSVDPSTGLFMQDSSFVDGFLIDDHDEFSCDVNGNTYMVEDNGGDKRLQNGSSSSSLVKGQWTPEEDSLLVTLVNKHGMRRWSQIAKNLVGRIGKQCRERWHNHLRPDIKKDIWTEEEERLLVEAHKKIGTAGPRLQSGSPAALRTP